MALVTLELFFPTNWACEGSVDLLYVDGASGVESSYGTLAQGGSLRQETYEGHRWNLREIASRELLMSLVAEAPAAGGPQSRASCAALQCTCSCRACRIACTHPSAPLRANAIRRRSAPHGPWWSGR